MRRGLQIAFAFAGFAFAWLRWHRRAPDRLPDRLRSAVERLGTTFVKLAQALSLRWDVLPEPYRDALGQLQQHAAPFPTEQAVAEIEHAFGAPVATSFARFDAVPLAAASIAQVHRAALPDGTPVIVKIRRPGIHEQVRRDLRLLKTTALAASWMLPALHRLRPAALVDELGAQLAQELDLRFEARNVRRLRAALADRTDVFVPAIVDPWIAEAVLVQELCDGKPVCDAAADQRVRLAGTLIDVYLHQLFVAGVFHADPHPGNVFVRADGRLCLLDFGLIGTLDPASRLALAAMLEAIACRDAAAALDAALALGFLADVPDRHDAERGIDAVLAEMQGLPLVEWSMAEAIWRIAQLGRGDSFRVPRRLLVLLRTLFLLESTTRQLAPQFDVVDALLQRRRLLESSAAARAGAPRLAPARKTLRTMREVPRLLAEWLHQARLDDGRPGFAMHHRGLNALEETLARTGNRLALALLALGLYVGGAVLMQQSAGPRLFGDLPLSAVAAFAMAAYLTVRLAWAIMRSGRL